MSWQPIETVPATDDEVLAISKLGGMKIETGRHLLALVEAAKVEGDSCYYTMWTPLPAPPAQELSSDPKIARNNPSVCENCGEPGPHWISTRNLPLVALITGQDDQDGFWTCPKLYGADGRRIGL